ncbi:hypothetical protein [Arthrobacter sp. NyZ413]|uniref:hypothetical protein n=1 Tax=Arthrobacter sp. NyZ413 TaxID=3144669 RepID=UPI003BF8054E
MLAGYLARHGIVFVRPFLLAAFGIVAWVLWNGGPSNASDLLPSAPAIPTPVPVPVVSVPAVPVPDPASLLKQLSGTAVKPLTGTVAPVVNAATPLINTVPRVNPVPLVNPAPVIDTVPPTVDHTIGALPDLLKLPGLPVLPLPAVPVPPPIAGTLPPPSNRPGEVPPALVPSAVQSATHPLPTTNAPAAPSRLVTAVGSVIFEPQLAFATPAASLAVTGSTGRATHPAPKPFTPVAPASGAGSMSAPQTSSVQGAADLPDQRALAPPLVGGPAIDARQSPPAEPAFDPGSSPD